MQHSPSTRHAHRANATARWASHLITAVALATLAACGGGGGSNTPAANTQSTVSGTVATGAAVSGTVTVKDATGAIKSAPIAADGSYSIDVTGLQAPLLLKAVGTVNGKAVTLLAPVTADNLNGTVNITPLSDLIVANLAGKAAAELFDAANADLSNAVNATALRNALADLKAKLAPLLAANGLSNTDFLNTPFTANSHTGVDGLLDQLTVTVNPTTKVATITNAVDGGTVTDDLTARDATPIVLPSNYSTKQTAYTDRLVGIQTLLKQFNDLFATSLPSQSAVEALCDAATYQDDSTANCSEWAAEQISNPKAIGLRVKLMRVVAFDASQPDNVDETKTVNGGFANNAVGVFVQNENSSQTDGQATKLTLGGDGKWRVAGTQRKVRIELRGYAYRDTVFPVSGLPKTYQDEGLNISINTAGTDVNRAVVTGPGLPAEGAVLTGNNQGHWVITDSSGFASDNGSSIWTAIANNLQAGDTPNRSSVYTVKVYNDSTEVATYQQHLGSDSIPTAPPVVAKFPSLTTVASTNWCSLSGASAAVSWTKPAGSSNEFVSALCAASKVDKGYGTGQVSEDTQATSSTYTPTPTQFPVRTFTPDYSELKVEVRGTDGVVYSTSVARNFSSTPVTIPPTTPAATGYHIDLVSGAIVADTASLAQGLTAVTNDFYTQHCDSNNNLLALNLPAASSVTRVTDLTQARGKSFAYTTCVPDGDGFIRTQISFDNIGGATAINAGPDGNSTFSFSQAQVTQAFSNTGVTDSSSGLTIFFRLYEQVVNSVSRFFLIEKDAPIGGGTTEYQLSK